GEMVSSGGAARSQRRRWEGGRRRLAGAAGAKLLFLAVARRDAVLLDLALDLLIPPLTRLVAIALLGTAAAALGSGITGVRLSSLYPWSASLLLLGIYVAAGWRSSGGGLRGLASLAWAPVYAAWKLTLARRPAESGEWVRTARERAKAT
ncbi:MAG: glycosyl transferase family 2, partial [Deltaproteobacteria bacterium]|nr:glycosyl transferase family 2 [Deltaproteobacteria bacterium]